MIDFECSSCGKSFSVSEKLAGRTGRCKACGKKIVVPKLKRPKPASDYGLEPLASPSDPLNSDFTGAHSPSGGADQSVDFASSISTNGSAPLHDFSQAYNSLALAYSYRKKAFGETLRYRPPNLHDYAGKQFCLRITLSDFHLDSCFFCYLDDKWEQASISQLLRHFFDVPSESARSFMYNEISRWSKVDQHLVDKYRLLQILFAKARNKQLVISTHVNNGPEVLSTSDAIHTHLGTSIWTDGKYNDKILDLVLVFRVPAVDPYTLPPDLVEYTIWKRFGLMHGPTDGSTPLASESSRRNALIVGGGALGILVLSSAVCCGAQVLADPRATEPSTYFSGGGL
jgi:DNA-directed RNA polymerase subunit RPC12/RpoP